MTGLGYQIRKQRVKRPLGRYTLAAIVHSLANDFLRPRRNSGRLDFSNTPEAFRPSYTA